MSKNSGQKPTSGTSKKGLALEVLVPRFAVCRLDPAAEVPSWTAGAFTSVTRSADELSIVCEDDGVPEGVRSERGWRAIKVLGPAHDQGPLDFSLVGVLASLSSPLAEAKISVFNVSTYDTDYLFVREKNLEKALRVLDAQGHAVEEVAPPGQSGPAERTPAEEPDEEEPEALEAEAEAEAPSATIGEPAEEPPPERERKAEPEPEPEPEPAEPTAEAVVEPVEPEVAAGEREAAEAAAPTAEPREAPAPKVKAPSPPPRRRRERDEAPGDDDERDAGSEGLFTGGIPQHPVETTDKRFDELGLSEGILATVAEAGFEHPTPIQAEIVPKALEGLDLIGLAETGSGKTAAFVLPLAERLTHGRGIRGLIVSPTREIALQTKAFLDLFGREHDLATACLIGGVRLGPQIQDLRGTPDILVATPGRLLDHVERRNVRLDRIEELVLDEADHMLDLGFLPQIREVLEHVPEERRTMMFSATMPPPIERLAHQYMRDPVLVDFRPAGHVAEGIEHRLYLVREEDRKACLVALIGEVEGSTLIFVRRKIEAEWLSNQLERAGFEVERIHSDRSQQQRVRALRGFKEGERRVLVATDVAARGVDIPRNRHVINFGLPETVEDYIHRAGRTARGKAGGIVSSIATWRDKIMIRDLEERLGQELPRCEVEGAEPYVELKPRKKIRRRLL